MSELRYAEQANQLSQQLWAIANDLRGTMDASEFKSYILGIIFYRYLSERTELFMNDLLKEDEISYEEAWNNDQFHSIVEEWSLSHLGYVIEPENLFRNLIKKINERTFDVEDLERAIKKLTSSTDGQPSAPTFAGLFDDMDLQSRNLGDTVKERSDLMSSVMTRIGMLDFDMQDEKFDLLGHTYMILIGLFQSGAGKKGGEFFTPVGPQKLCARLATYGLTEAKNVSDSCCGSASMLLEVANHVKVSQFYGQEKAATTYNMARMNMLMHGVDWQKFHLFKGDTLTTDNYGDIKFTVQVENPPYSLKWTADSKFLDDPRYSGAGVLAPKSHADLAFLEHMIYHMDPDDGRIAILLPHGVLFRGSSEEAIRKYIIRDLNRLDAVIGLPANLFHGTSIPVTCLVLKSKRNGNSNNILFIDASKDFKPGKNQNELPDEAIDRIVDAYAKREDIERYAHVATMEEIEENGYNLNIPRYVDTAEKEQEIDIDEVFAKIQTTDNEIAEATASLNEFLRQLGLKEL